MKSSLLILSLLIAFSPCADAKVLNYKKVRTLANDILKTGNFGLADITINDIETFCPNYNQFSVDEKNNFFANLVAEISMYESDFDTNQTFIENNGNLSAGLMQISYGSISEEYKANGCADIKLAEDLKDASKNIKCGLGIITTLIKSHSDHLADPEKGGASSYWSTLRLPYTVVLKASNKTVTVGKKLEIISDLKDRDPDCFKK